MKMKSSEEWKSKQISLETAKVRNRLQITIRWTKRRNLTRFCPTILMIYNRRLATLTSKNT